MSEAIQYKMIRAVTKEAGPGRIHAVVSTESVDRVGDVIRAKGWDLSHFKAHPVLVASHDYSDIRSQIGEWEDMKVTGTQLEGTARYYVGEGNEQADWAFNLAAKGKAAFSVGFRPDRASMKDLDGGGIEFNKQELLEVSHVVVPANPDALQAMKALGGDPVKVSIIDELITNTEEEADRIVDDLDEKSPHEHEHGHRGSARTYTQDEVDAMLLTVKDELIEQIKAETSAITVPSDLAETLRSAMKEARSV